MRARAEEDEECAIVDTGRSPSHAVARRGHAWPERGQPWAGGLSRCDRASTRASTNEKDVRHIECGGQTGRSRQCLEHQWPGLSRARARPSLSLSLRHNARLYQWDGSTGKPMANFTSAFPPGLSINGLSHHFAVTSVGDRLYTVRYDKAQINTISGADGRFLALWSSHQSARVAPTSLTVLEDGGAGVSGLLVADPTGSISQCVWQLDGGGHAISAIKPGWSSLTLVRDMVTLREGSTVSSSSIPQDDGSAVPHAGELLILAQSLCDGADSAAPG